MREAQLVHKQMYSAFFNAKERASEAHVNLQEARGLALRAIDAEVVAARRADQFTAAATIACSARNEVLQVCIYCA